MNPEPETKTKAKPRRPISFDDWGTAILMIAWGGLLTHLFLHDFLIA